MNRNYTHGRVLCKGSGLKAYLELKLNRKNASGEVEWKTFRYEVGNLEKLLTESNRQTVRSYVAGRKNSVAVAKGIRSVYGTVTFSQLDGNMVSLLLKDIKQWNVEKTALEKADLNNFSFDDWNLNEKNASLVNEATEELAVELFEEEIIQLDDLPPVDLVIVGTADQIDSQRGTYETGNTYMFIARKVSFLSETFGISAGSPIHNVASKILILGGVEPWHKVKDGD